MHRLLAVVVGAMVAGGALAPPADQEPARTFAAESFGAAPGADPVLNTRAIQTALEQAVAAHGGTATVTAAGTFDLAAQGLNPGLAGHRYCLQVAGDGVTLRVGPASVLRLADGQQTDAGGAVDVVLLTGRNVAVDGGGAIRGNTAGQTGWTRGYAQNLNGTLIFAYAPAGGSEGVRIEDLDLEDAFSNPVFTLGRTESPTRGVTIARVHARDTGEGPMVVNATDVRLLDSSFENRSIARHPGDGFELSNVSSFEARGLSVRGRLGGSAIDLYGARDGRLEHFLFDGVVEGVMVQENGTYGTYSENVVVSDGYVSVVGPEGNGVLTKGRKVRNVMVEDVHVLGPNTRAMTYGFQVGADDVPTEGPVTLLNCEARGHEAGLLVKTVAGLTVEGGEYSNNRRSPGSDGIRWVGEGGARGPDDTRGLAIRNVRASGNRRFGIRLDSYSAQGKLYQGKEPSGEISGCRLSGNGAGGLGVRSGDDPRYNVAADVAIHDIEPHRCSGQIGPVAGLRAFTPQVPLLATLTGPHKDQGLVLTFDRAVRVVDASQPGGRDLFLAGRQGFTAEPGARLCVQWDGRRWQERWREAAARPAAAGR